MSPEDRKDRMQREAAEHARVKSDDAAQIARWEIPDGRVIDVDLETIRGTNAVEVEKDNRVQVVLVDLQNGDVLCVRSKRENSDDDDDDDDDEERSSKPLN